MTLLYETLQPWKRFAPLTARPPRRPPPPPRPPLPAAAEVVATLLAAFHASELLRRAPEARLVGASLEHAAVIAGEDLGTDEDLLRLAARDARALASTRSELAATLVRGLAARVPRAAGADARAHDVAVNDFVASLLRMHEINLTATPVTARFEAPAAFIGSTPAWNTTLSVVFHSNTSPHAAILALAAHERDHARAAALVELGVSNGAAAAVAAGAAVAAAATAVLTWQGAGALRIGALLGAGGRARVLIDVACRALLALAAVVYSAVSAWRTAGRPADWLEFKARVAAPVVAFLTSTRGLAAEAAALRARVSAQLAHWSALLVLQELARLAARPRLAAADVARLADDLAGAADAAGNLPASLTASLDEFLRREVDDDDAGGDACGGCGAAGSALGSALTRTLREAGAAERAAEDAEYYEVQSVEKLKAKLGKLGLSKAAAEAIGALVEAGCSATTPPPRPAVDHFAALAAPRLRDAGAESAAAAAAAADSAVAAATARAAEERRARRAAAAAAAAAMAHGPAGGGSYAADADADGDGDGDDNDEDEDAGDGAAASRAAPAQRPPLPRRRAAGKCTASEMLRAGGWTLVRAKNHYVYKRRTARGVQTTTASKTPSDVRAERNFIADLRRADRALEGE